MKFITSLLILSSVLLAEPPKMEALRVETTPDVPKAQWTFKYEPTRAPYALGLIKPQKERGAIEVPPSKKYLKADIKLPRRFDLRDLYKLTPIFDQGQCGSCVYNAGTAVLIDMYIMAGLDTGVLSRQHAMCLSPWSCSGSVATNFADGVMKNGGLALESAYPYMARDASCRQAPQIFGNIVGRTVIDNSAKSIMTAIFLRHPPMATVGADNPWMGYRGGGVYNACSNAATNHENALYGWDCEDSYYTENGVEYCKYDANGNLPANVGIYIDRNSWNTGWGDAGWMRTKITSRNGQRCNNIAEEVVVLDIGHEPPSPTPSPTITPTPSPSPSPGPAPEPSVFDWKWIGIILALLASFAGMVIALVRKP